MPFRCLDTADSADGFRYGRKQQRQVFADVTWWDGRGRRRHRRGRTRWTGTARQVPDAPGPARPVRPGGGPLAPRSTRSGSNARPSPAAGVGVPDRPPPVTHGNRGVGWTTGVGRIDSRGDGGAAPARSRAGSSARRADASNPAAATLIRTAPPGVCPGDHGRPRRSVGRRIEAPRRRGTGSSAQRCIRGRDALAVSVAASARRPGQDRPDRPPGATTA